MQVNSVTPLSGGPAANSSQIAALQKQLKDLTKQLDDLASNTSLDAKAKQMETQLLQAQIVSVQTQIAALQNQQHQHLEHISQQQAAASNTPAKKKDKAQSAVGATEHVDVFT